jgi:hypothetical protein
VRNPKGLTAARRLQLVRLAERLTAHELPGYTKIAAALPLLDTLAAVLAGRGGAPARER